jgi:uncharacterized damage-inducible protein DinB
MTTELAAIFRRDLTKLLQEVQGFPDDDSIWLTPAGMNNSPGNLVLHLEGNLREYIGRQIGGIAFQRARPLEFSSKGLMRAELSNRIEQLISAIPEVLQKMPASRLDEMYPENVLGQPLSIAHFLLHLVGHFNYHLGQIDAARRGVTGKGPVRFPAV